MKLIHIIQVIVLCTIVLLSSRISGAPPRRPRTIPKGHLQPLGSHKPPHHVVELDTIPSPRSFFDDYVSPSKPVLLRGAAKPIPAYELWTDEYIRYNYGRVKIKVRITKKENLSEDTELFLNLRKFLRRYKTEDMQAVHTLPKSMKRDVTMPSCVSCGGFAQKLQDVVLWFSNGGTKSILLPESVESLNCMLRGSQEYFLIDKETETYDYTAVDVDKVDLLRYKSLAKVDWFHANVSVGDCLYIPYGWAHQFRTYDNNLAVSMWWSPMEKFNETSCIGNTGTSYLKVSGFDAAMYEIARASIIYGMPDHGRVSKSRMASIIDELDQDLGQYDLQTVLSAFDANADNIITVEEINRLSHEDLMRLFPKYKNEDYDQGEEEDHDEL